MKGGKTCRCGRAHIHVGMRAMHGIFARIVEISSHIHAQMQTRTDIVSSPPPPPSLTSLISSRLRGFANTLAFAYTGGTPDLNGHNGAGVERRGIRRRFAPEGGPEAAEGQLNGLPLAVLCIKAPAQ